MVMGSNLEVLPKERGPPGADEVEGVVESI